jgi:hypothetical protein
MATSALCRVSQGCRHISSALMVLKNLSTAALLIVIALAAHGHFEVMLAQDFLVIMRTVLRAAILVMDAAL